ncbi:MAG TPA: glycine cleavage system protein GcvH [Planctomycetota bacterium]|nr:glycine cleavage system protein GcvH [Planctomycetota bacterium]
MSNVVPGLKYSKEHEWVKMEGNVALVGITDHAQAALGDIVFCDLPKVGKEVVYMKPFGVVESVKAASDVFSPLSGKIVAVNELLSKQPETINQDPYGKGWLVKIELSKPDELNQLMDDKGYSALVNK